MIYDRREEYRIARLLQLPVYFTIIPPLPRSAGYIRPGHEYALLLFRDFPSHPSSQRTTYQCLAMIYLEMFRNLEISIEILRIFFFFLWNFRITLNG